MSPRLYTAILLGLASCASAQSDSLRPVQVIVRGAMGLAYTYTKFQNEQESEAVQDLLDESRGASHMDLEVGLISRSSGLGAMLCYANLNSNPGSASPHTNSGSNAYGPWSEHIEVYSPTIQLKFLGPAGMSYQAIEETPFRWSAALGVGKIWRSVDTDIKGSYDSWGEIGNFSATKTVHQEGIGFLLGAGIDYQFASRFCASLDGRLITGDVEETYRAINDDKRPTREGKERIDHLALTGGLRIVF